MMRFAILLPTVLALVSASAGDFGFAVLTRERPDGPATTVTADGASGREETHDGDRTVTTYSYASGPLRRVTTVVRADGAGCRACTLDCETASGWHVERISYPEAKVRDPGAGSAADRIVLGSSKGGVTADPMSKPSAPEAGLADSRSAPVDWCRCFDLPGSGIAPFAAIWNGPRGICLSADDDSARVQTIGFYRTRNGLFAFHFRFGWETGLVRMGYEVSVREVRLGRPLDWRDFADLARTAERDKPWRRDVRPFVERPDIPDWMKDAPAMVRFSRQWLEHPEDVERFVRWWRHEFGGGPVIAALWGWEKVGTWWGPDYFPCWPDDATFRRVTGFLRANGFHPFAWPSGYNWCERSGIRPDGTCELDYRGTFLREHASRLCLGRDGRPFVRDAFWLRNGRLAAVCGGLDWTHRWWNDLVRGLGTRGCDIVQVDQVVGGLAPECWSADHGHPVDYLGPWMAERFRTQLGTMRDALRESQPQGIVCVEEPNEKLIGAVGLQDYRDLETRADEFAGVFGYLHHGEVPVFQSNHFRDEPYSLAFMAAEGQIPFFRMLRDDLAGEVPALANGGFEDLVDNVRGPAGWTRLSDMPILAGYDRTRPAWDFDGWSNFGWGRKGAALESAETHSGSFALRLEAGKTLPAQVSQLVEGLADGEYELSAWVKGEGEGRLRCGTRAGETGAVAFPAKAADWTRVALKVRPVCGELKVLAFVTSGTVLIDDIRLADAEGRTVLRRGDTPYLRTFRAWLKLYRGEGRDFLANGFMIRPPELRCGTTRLAARTLPAVRHAAYRASDGRTALVLANGTRERQACSCAWDGEDRTFTLESGEIRLVKGETK